MMNLPYGVLNEETCCQVRFEKILCKNGNLIWRGRFILYILYINYLKQLNETISCSDKLSAKREAGVSPARLPSLY